MARAGKAGKGKGINVNLSGVETSKVAAEGRYQVKLDKATLETSQNSGGQYIKFEFVSPDGIRLYHNASLQPQALFNLKAVLEALGFEIPGKAFDLELGDLIGLECEVDVVHETYEGKKKARIAEFISLDADSEEDDEEEEDESTDYESMTLKELIAEVKGRDNLEVPNNPKKPALIKMLEADDAEESKEDDDEEEDYSELSLEELIEECEERGIKVPKKAKKPALIELLEEDDAE